jgi:hypothetical protein
MKKRTFPKLIHVTREGESDDSFLAVQADGVQSVNDAGTPIAIYQLVDQGQVTIQRQFQSTRK